MPMPYYKSKALPMQNSFKTKIPYFYTLKNVKVE